MELMKNWKTTGAGVGMILVALGHIVASMSAGGGVGPEDIMGIITGVGLITAKDANSEVKK